MEVVFKDFLGYPIEEEMRAVRVDEYDHYKKFQKCTVKKIDPGHKSGAYAKTPIGIVSDGNERIGWTFPERIITEQAFKEKL